MNFILASSNTHKLEELKNYFAPLQQFKLELPPEKIAVEETGNSYYENAHLKAEKYYQAFKRPALADDSGLNVAALPNDLGIHSSRFGGGNLTDAEKNELLLTKLGENREASFTCVLCFYLNPQEIFFFEGNLKGTIAHAIKGEKGFGYDPVFIPEGQNTLAMIPDWKASNSHRAKAAASAVQFFRERDCQSL
ncbi:MAG: non-canonical purine NTP pyrophosphatase [Epsilonproteobacteria bacterium]|nr:MAG: non-canonical purine NTP pyrophosphatase [Campylobacterota bacterium]RLA66112.1 MAG: non-canonical purine NTP pyrophosphatase [Campylobacterota bacterium]